MKANYYGLHEQGFCPNKSRDFLRYHHVDGGYGAHAPSYQIRPEVFFSETKRPERETRIFNALPPDTYPPNTMMINP